MVGGVPLGADNQAAIKMAQNDADSAKTKHVGVAYHFIRQAEAAGVVKIRYVNTADNVADVFTKPLGEQKFYKFCQLMGVA